jgi:hypothetical protein
MNLTDTELEALAIARSCAQAGQAFVPVPEVEIFCKNLARHGWLTPEPQDNGDVAYAWSQKAETALGLNNLMTPDPSRTN